jgi:hypothetical protein
MNLEDGGFSSAKENPGVRTSPHTRMMLRYLHKEKKDISQAFWG